MLQTFRHANQDNSLAISQNSIDEVDVTFREKSRSLCYKHLHAFTSSLGICVCFCIYRYTAFLLCFVLSLAFGIFSGIHSGLRERREETNKVPLTVLEFTFHLPARSKKGWIGCLNFATSLASPHTLTLKSL